MAQSKIELLLSLKNRMQTGLENAKKQLSSGVDSMKKKIKELRAAHVEAFSAMKAEIPHLARGIELLTNPYILAAAAAVGLGIALYKCVDAAAEFNTEFVALKNLNMDKSKEEIAGLKNDILDAALATGVSAKDMLGAFSDIQGGLDIFGKEVDIIARKVSEFSLGTQSDLANNINSTVKAMQAFGFGAERLDEYLASNAKAVNVGIASFEELGRVQTEFAGAAAAAGQDFNVANKLFATFSLSAKNAEIAATQTRSAFAGLTMKPTIEGLRQIGVHMTDGEGKMKNLETVIRELVPEISKMSDQKFLKFRNAIGGPEGLQNLFNQLRTSGEKVLDTFEGFDRSEFSIAEALKNAKGDLNTMKTILGNQINNIMIRIGDSLMPAILQAIGFVVDKVTELFTQIKKVYDESAYLKDLFSVIGTVLKVVIITPFAALYAAIKSIVTLTQYWVKALDPVYRFVKAIMAGLWEVIKGAGSALMNFIDPLWQKLKEWKDGIKTFFTDLFTGIKNSLNTLIDNIVSGIKNLINRLSKIPGIGRIIDKFAEGYRKSVKNPNIPTAPAGGDGDGTNPTPRNDGGISDVVKESQSAKVLNVTIQALHRGDNKIINEKGGSGMTMQDLERMMTELMLRAVRNLEGAY